jgi:hypothetical protein
MPLAAYFRNVGAALLVLLFVADFYLPTTPAAQRAAAYPPIIRIHSDRKWPERVVFDTTTAIVSAKPVAWDTNVAASPRTGDVPTSHADASRVRDAFAMLPPTDSRGTESAAQDKRQSKVAARPVRKKSRPHILPASPDRQFAWFGFRPWVIEDQGRQRWN